MRTSPLGVWRAALLVTRNRPGGTIWLLAACGALVVLVAAATRLSRATLGA